MTILIAILYLTLTIMGLSFPFSQNFRSLSVGNPFRYLIGALIFLLPALGAYYWDYMRSWDFQRDDLIFLSYLFLVAFLPSMLQRFYSHESQTRVNLLCAFLLGLPFFPLHPVQKNAIFIAEVPFRYDFLLCGGILFFFYRDLPEEAKTWNFQPIKPQSVFSIGVVCTSIFFLAGSLSNYFVYSFFSLSLQSLIYFLYLSLHLSLVREAYFRMFFQQIFRKYFSGQFWFVPSLISASLFALALGLDSFSGVKAFLGVILGLGTGLLLNQTINVFYSWGLHVILLFLSFIFFETVF